MGDFKLIPFATAKELARSVADAWLNEMTSAVRNGKSFHVALSGGRIANKLFETVVSQSREKRISFEQVHFFWADERCVPPDNSESNYRVARELLFDPLEVPGKNIHRIRGELEPAKAADLAEEEIRRVASVSGIETLDLIFLGMGEDGHVASLFPGEYEALVSDKSVYRAITNSPKPPPNRVTLGYEAIAAAKQVWVLVSGAGKQAALRESLMADGKTPLARVLQLRKHTRIFTDVPV
jgi:6-phosphogluconolactonase